MLFQFLCLIPSLQHPTECHLFYYIGESISCGEGLLCVIYMSYMLFIMLDTLVYSCLWSYARWGDALESEQHSISGFVHIVLYVKNMQNCLTYDVAFELQKTREWSPTPFSKCRVDNSGPHQNGGLGDQHEYWFTRPGSLHISYLHIYHLISMSIDSPDTYLVSCRRWVRGSITPDSPKIFSHDHYHISDVWAPKWSELGLKAQYHKNSFICVVSNHKLYTDFK